MTTSTNTATASNSRLRVGYIPEHFASPLLQLARSPWGQANIDLVPCPSGTGQVLSSFDSGSTSGQTIDVAIALTESLIAGIAKGRKDIKLVGSYVRSSLVWAVITGGPSSLAASKYKGIGDLKGSDIGISRVGSGSQIMGSVMALQQQWGPSDIGFAVKDTFQGLRDSVNDGSTSAFMWETFTTKPYFDTGEVSKIGEVPTPWPGWSIAASVDTTLAGADQRAKLEDFLQRLQQSIVDFTSPSSFAANAPRDFIVGELKYQPRDVEDWLQTVRWVGEGRPNDEHNTANLLDNGQSTTTTTVSRQTLAKTLKTLHEAGVLTQKQAIDEADPDLFVDPWGNGSEGRLVA